MWSMPCTRWDWFPRAGHCRRARKSGGKGPGLRGSCFPAGSGRPGKTYQLAKAESGKNYRIPGVEKYINGSVINFQQPRYQRVRSCNGQVGTGRATRTTHSENITCWNSSPRRIPGTVVLRQGEPLASNGNGETKERFPGAEWKHFRRRGHLMSPIADLTSGAVH